jgi:hypothetical protein
VGDGKGPGLHGTRGRPRNAPLKKGALDLAAGEPLRLHVFLDASVIETVRERPGRHHRSRYPSDPGAAIGIGVFARGGPAVLRSLEVWDLRPISDDRLTSGPLE